MVGVWKGFYDFEDTGLWVKTNLDVIPFEMRIDFFDGYKFKGIVVDKILTINNYFGVVGFIKNQEIRFKKFVTTKDTLETSNSFTDEDKKIHIINYKGRMLLNNSANGTWKMNDIFNDYKILNIKVPLLQKKRKGSWKMELITSRLA